MPIIEPSNYGQQFRSYYFPDASDEEWGSWKWQLANRLLSLEALEKVLELTEEEREFFPKYEGQRLPFALTPYYMRSPSPENIMWSVATLTTLWVKSSFRRCPAWCINTRIGYYC